MELVEAAEKNSQEDAVVHFHHLQTRSLPPVPPWIPASVTFCGVFFLTLLFNCMSQPWLHLRITWDVSLNLPVTQFHPQKSWFRRSVWGLVMSIFLNRLTSHDSNIQH